MAGGSNGYRAALVRRQHTRVLISSFPDGRIAAVYLILSDYGNRRSFVSSNESARPRCS
jgi:hypothetical protein